ncbi:hypothetical protein J6590_076875 [Homalodisca vitripennis]|nr:hypothetical protein J6590_076875 [Homalodisca vitripennis]
MDYSSLSTVTVLSHGNPPGAIWEGKVEGRGRNLSRSLDSFTKRRGIGHYTCHVAEGVEPSSVLATSNEIG